jgi:hypothetical protein
VPAPVSFSIHCHRVKLSHSYTTQFNGAREDVREGVDQGGGEVIINTKEDGGGCIVIVLKAKIGRPNMTPVKPRDTGIH